MTKRELIKQIEAELNDIYNFMSAEENAGFVFTMSEAESRAKYLEKKLKDLLK
jgi:hypothetical protein